MHITDDMIDPQLLPVGPMLRLQGLMHSEWGLRLLEKGTRPLKYMPAHGMQRQSLTIPRGQSPSKLRLLVMKPLQPRERAPGLLWLHGGGYALGAAEMASQGVPKQLMAQSGCVVVAPDYRLSVEAPYPAALHDAYDALLWMKEHAAELGIDDHRLIVGGESAGGGLAAALCLYARDRGEVAIAFQMPLYPMLDDRMTTESAQFEGAPVWDRQSNALGWQLYLGPLFGSDAVPAYAAAGRATNLAGLPPAISFVGSIELFRDETVAYFDGLRRAGVPARLELYDGCYHAFDMLKPNADVSKQALAFLQEAYREALERYTARQPAG